jgi:hypothetical protein
VSAPGLTGLAAAFGSLLVADDGSGAWVLRDAANRTLVASDGPPSRVVSVGGEAGVLLPVRGAGAGAGPSQAQNCLQNGQVGAGIHYYNRAGGYVAFPAAAWLYEPISPHCHPTSFQGPPPAAARDPFSCAGNATVQGRAAAPAGRAASGNFPSGMTGIGLAYCCSICNGDSANGAPANDAACVGFEFTEATETAPSLCAPLWAFGALVDAPAGTSFTGPARPQPPPAAAPGWWALGSAVDWFLAPAAAPLAATRALYDLTGAPAVPPLWAMGFMATYWSYEKMEYVEGNVTAFRDGDFPIDAHIMDYDVRQAVRRAARVASLSHVSPPPSRSGGTRTGGSPGRALTTL